MTAAVVTCRGHLFTTQLECVMRAASLPPTDILHQLFRYDEATGILYWKRRDGRSAWNSRYANKAAGAIKRKRDGRPVGMCVEINGQPFHVHRLIWAIVHGSLSQDLEVDHRDCNPLNNKIGNLRLANNQQQSSNSRMLRRTLSGTKGVKPHRDKFQARIKVNGKSRHLGTFATLEEARVAYRMASVEAFGEFALQQ
jgi:hypothetical protein